MRFALRGNGERGTSDGEFGTDRDDVADDHERGRLEPEELAKFFPDTLGKGLHEPPGTNFGKSLSERPKGEWKDLGKGVRYWQSPWEAR